MVFGKIEYLNLLPFHVFMKRYTKSSQQAQSMHYKRGVPADINQKFLTRRVDAAYISSVHAKKHRFVNLGIVAKKEVLSVLVIPHAKRKIDNESATSNILADLLDIQGEVLIGDKALKYALANDDYIDLVSEWYKKYQLPFVFALLCYHKDAKLYKNIQKHFLTKPIKIPQYILNKASSRTEISSKDILYYLEYISYKVDTKALLGLKKFYKDIKKSEIL